MSVTIKLLLREGRPFVQASFHGGSSKDHLTFEPEDPELMKGARISSVVAEAGDWSTRELHATVRPGMSMIQLNGVQVRDMDFQKINFLCQWGPPLDQPLVLCFMAEHWAVVVQISPPPSPMPQDSCSEPPSKVGLEGSVTFSPKGNGDICRASWSGFPATPPTEPADSVSNERSISPTPQPCSRSPWSDDMPPIEPVGSLLSGKRATPRLQTSNHDLEVLLGRELPCVDMPLWKMEGIVWTNYAVPLSASRPGFQYIIVLTRIALYLLEFSKVCNEPDEGLHPTCSETSTGDTQGLSSSISVAIVSRIEPPDLECKLPQCIVVLPDGTETKVFSEEKTNLSLLVTSTPNGLSLRTLQVAQRSSDIVIINKEGALSGTGEVSCSKCGRIEGGDKEDFQGEAYMWLRLESNSHRGELMNCMDEWFRRRMEQDFFIEQQKDSLVRDYLSSRHMLDLTLYRMSPSTMLKEVTVPREAVPFAKDGGHFRKCTVRCETSPLHISLDGSCHYHGRSSSDIPDAEHEGELCSSISALCCSTLEVDELRGIRTNIISPLLIESSDEPVKIMRWSSGCRTLQLSL